MRHRNFWSALILLLVLALLAAACADDADQADPEEPAAEEPADEEPADEEPADGEPADEEPAADPTTVALGYQVSLWGSPLVVAEEQGFWGEGGIEADSTTFSAGAEVRDALIAGSVDGGSVGVTPFIVGAATGEMVATASAGYVGDTLAVTVNPELGLESVEDLEGLSIASQAGSTTELVFFEQVAPEFGITQDDVELANVPFDNHVAALATGQVDAFLGVEPFNSIAVTQGSGEVLETFGDYDLVPNFLVFRREFVEENHDAAVGATHGFLQAVDWMNENFDEAVELVLGELEATGATVDEESLRASMEVMDLNPEFVDELEDYLTEQAELLVEAGEIDEVPDWDDALRRDILEEAQQDH